MKIIGSRAVGTFALLTTCITIVGCTSGRSASSAPASPTTPEVEAAPVMPSGRIQLPGGIECRVRDREVHVPGFIAIDAGWIEQVACLRGTREHESIVVVDCQPSLVHSALLMIGLESGSPGRWLETLRGDRYVIERIPPTGSSVRVRVRFKDRNGNEIESSVEELITRSAEQDVLPSTPWIFAGSRFDSKERYVADFSGSLIGFATFGDEVLGLPGVISDQVSVDAAVWEIRTERVPSPGTPVTIVLSPWER